MSPRDSAGQPVQGPGPCALHDSGSQRGQPILQAAQYKKGPDLKTVIESLRRITITIGSRSGLLWRMLLRPRRWGTRGAGGTRKSLGLSKVTARRRWAGPEHALSKESGCEKTRAER